MSTRRRRLGLAMLALVGIATGALLAWAWVYQSPPSDLSGLPPACVAAVEQLRDERGSPAARCDVRAWYLEQVGAIAEVDGQLAAAGVDLARRARCAYSLRHEARLEARALMPSRLQLALLRLRDLLTYGDPDGPHFESLVDPAHPDDSYRRIIATASMTNERVDQSCEFDPAGGPGAQSPPPSPPLSPPSKSP